MTLIQCFSPSLLDNLAGCLRLRPEKLVLLGDIQQMEAPAWQYRAIAKARGISMNVELRPIQGRDIGYIAGLLSDILSREKNCIIDLTGSDELVAMAVGATVAGMRDRSHVSVQRYDRATDTDVDCDGDGRVIAGSPAFLTVPELIALHGGTIHPSLRQLPLRADLRDLDALWPIVSAAPREWNRNISVLREFESRSYADDHVLLPLEELRGCIKDFEEKKGQLLSLLEKFRRRGVIRDSGSRDLLNYRYTSQLLQYCVEKAGNVLEVKTLLEAMALREGKGELFQDACMGVSIDWDGIIHTPADKVPDTRNEIDIILIRGLTPLFISCKNGDIGDEELYKLHTVATRFGGPYARKMLIATDLDRKNKAADRAFEQRAWDMDIVLEPDAAQLEPWEWETLFRFAVKE